MPLRPVFKHMYVEDDAEEGGILTAGEATVCIVVNVPIIIDIYSI